MNTMTTEQLTKVNDPQRSEYSQFLQLYALADNFVCQGCNKSYGSIFKMGEDCAISLDGLTGLTTIAKTNHVGGRPIVSWPEIYTIQSSIELFADLWWGSTECSAIIIAHVEKEQSPITGLTYLATATLGNKLAPKLDKKPDDVILAVRSEDRYLWDTIEKGMELKSRHLPRANNLPADFRQIFK